MSNIYGNGAKGKATRLHAQIVRARGLCERCGRAEGRLECAHIISRSYAATRTKERNAWCLCWACHRRLTEHPDEHMQFVAQTIGMDAFDRLKQLALSREKVDWPAEAERLSVWWKHLQSESFT